MEILFDVVGNEPRNVGVYCVRHEIKFLIGPLHRFQACYFRLIWDCSMYLHRSAFK